jgi:putative hemolysin
LDASGYTLEFIIIALLLLTAAFFSGSEAALLSANRTRLRALSEERHRRAEEALALLENPARLFSTLLIGNNIASAGAAVLATFVSMRLLDPQRGAVYGFGIITVLLLIVGDIAPKSIAAHYADRLALAVVRPVQWTLRLLGPLVRLLSFLTNILTRPFGARVRTDAPMVTEEEIQMIVRRGEEQGVLEQDEREMIHSIFAFGDTVVREVMVPRIDMVCVEDDAPIDAILEVVRTHGHSRIPIYHETIDQIIGLVHVKDLLSALRAGTLNGKVREFVRPAFFVPETKRLDELFREMRRKKAHMAIAVDEYGGTAGLVTIEDLLEEIVGPIQDEYDVEEPPIKVLNERVALVDGRVNVEDVNAALHLALPAGEVDSVGGFVYSLLGHVPAQGEQVIYDGVEIAVERVDGNRIAQVKITRVEPVSSVDE